MFEPDDIRRMMLIAPPLLLSLTIHEYSHARMALYFGDPTAKHNGRLTLNPLKHLDPIGTLMLLFSGVMGWAKPVPVNPFNLRPLRLGQIMVSLAGPLSNLSLAIISGLLLRGWMHWAPDQHAAYDTVWILLWYTAAANLGLCFFNLIPLFPLDGHHILRELLPVPMQQGFMHWQMRFGSFALIAMLIGPRLLETVSRGRTPYDPLEMVLSYVIRPILQLLLYWTPGAPGV